MKHLLTAIACCLAVAGSAQTPYNPDSDSDNLMGAEDLMSLLSLYGGEFYPETNSSDSIVIYDMTAEIDAHWQAWQCCDLEYPVITLPVSCDLVVVRGTPSDFCNQGGTYCSRVILEFEESYLYDQIRVVWESGNTYPYNYTNWNTRWTEVFVNSEYGWLSTMPNQ